MKSKIQKMRQGKFQVYENFFKIFLDLYIIKQKQWTNKKKRGIFLRK